MPTNQIHLPVHPSRAFICWDTPCLCHIVKGVLYIEDPSPKFINNWKLQLCFEDREGTIYCFGPRRELHQRIKSAEDATFKKPYEFTSGEMALCFSHMGGWYGLESKADGLHISIYDDRWTYILKPSTSEVAAFSTDDYAKEIFTELRAEYEALGLSKFCAEVDIKRCYTDIARIHRFYTQRIGLPTTKYAPIVFGDCRWPERVSAYAMPTLPAANQLPSLGLPEILEHFGGRGTSGIFIPAGETLEDVLAGKFKVFPIFPRQLKYIPIEDKAVLEKFRDKHLGSNYEIVTAEHTILAPGAINSGVILLLEHPHVAWRRNKEAVARYQFPLEPEDSITDLIMDKLEVIKLDSNSTLTVNGYNEITCEGYSSCIQTSGKLTLRGNGTIKLIAPSRSVCIGYGAEAQSMGRYVASWQEPLKEIVVDGCHLICECATPNFSVGRYARDDKVVVTCINGGTIEGVPEALGRVKLISVGDTYAGSTKLTGNPVYELTPFECSKSVATSEHTNLFS